MKCKKTFILSKKSILIFIVIFCIITTIFIGNYIYSQSFDFSYACIVIDPGHGGWDGGSVGASGICESSITLDISRRLKEKLKKYNFEVILTREEDKALGDTKLQDMKARAKIINESNCDIVISIHVNKFNDTTRRGVQVFYDDLLVGDDFAMIMQDYLNNNINKKYCKRNNYIALSGDFYITKCVFVPSIIIESGFISNLEDEKLLQEDKYKNDLVDTIVQACVDIFTKNRV